MLGRRRRRWSNNKTTLVQLAFAKVPPDGYDGVGGGGVHTNPEVTTFLLEKTPGVVNGEVTRSSEITTIYPNCQLPVPPPPQPALLLPWHSPPPPQTKQPSL